MIFKKMISILIVILLSVNFSANAEEDFCSIKSTSDDSVLDCIEKKKSNDHCLGANFNNHIDDTKNDSKSIAQEVCTDQNSGDDLNDNIAGKVDCNEDDFKNEVVRCDEGESIRQEIKKMLVNFLCTVYPKFDSEIKTFLENYGENGKDCDRVCSEKSCGCWIEISKGYHSLVGDLCAEHIQLFFSQVPESYINASMYKYWIEIIQENRFQLGNSLPAEESYLEDSDETTDELQMSDEITMQDDYAEDDLDDSIFAGMLEDIKSLRLEDIWQCNC